MSQVKGVRQTPLGSWEATFYLDGKRKSKTFKTQAEAEQFKMAQDSVKSSAKLTIGGMVSSYLQSSNENIAPSTAEVLQQLTGMTTAVEDMDHAWADKWISELKAKKITPDTIKKKVSPLANVLSWHNKQQGQPEKYNPLKNLSPNYASYGNIKDAPVNKSRNRRLTAVEVERIEAAIMGQWKGDNREKFYAASDEDRTAFLMLFKLIIDTGLRLREAFTLMNMNIVAQDDQGYIDLKRPSKRGEERVVPIKPQLLSMLKNFASGSPREPVFPFWSGIESEDVMRAIGNKLSKRFGSLFSYCGYPDIVEHDLRHEAICRWLEMKDKQGNWLLRTEEVRTISGHKSTAAFDIYLSFRGQDFLPRIYQLAA